MNVSNDEVEKKDITIQPDVLEQTPDKIKEKKVKPFIMTEGRKKNLEKANAQRQMNKVMRKNIADDLLSSLESLQKTCTEKIQSINPDYYLNKKKVEPIQNNNKEKTNFKIEKMEKQSTVEESSDSSEDEEALLKAKAKAKSKAKKAKKEAKKVVYADSSSSESESEVETDSSEEIQRKRSNKRSSKGKRRDRKERYEDNLAPIPKNIQEPVQQQQQQPQIINRFIKPEFGCRFL